MNKNKRVTLQKISSASGFSVAVVSRALSNDILQNRTVAPETASRIIAAARQLGWVPRRSLQKKRSLGAVGVFIPPNTGVLVQELLEAVNAVARTNDTPIYYYSAANSNSFRQFWENHGASSRSIGAVSYYPSTPEDIPDFMKMYENFRKREAPLVIIHNNAPDDFPAVSVKIDNFYGGQLAGQYLADLNCQQNYLIGFGYTPYRYDRLMGCCNVLNSHSCFYHLITRSNEQDFSFVSQLEHLADKSGNETVGIFADGMYSALHIHNYFQSKGVEIGKKLRLISYDDSIWLRCAYPAITAVRQPFYQMGETAMRKLFNMMRGYSENGEYIKPELIIRQS